MKRATLAASCLLALGVGIQLSPSILSEATAQSATAVEATFAIKNMTCALCPLTVRKAIEGVEGVRSVLVDFDAKTATVIFDPTVATTEAIAAASTNVGYPAMVEG